MDLDEMKRSWQSLETRVSRLENENTRLSEKLRKSSAGSLKHRLQRNCVLMMCFGLLAPSIMIPIRDEIGFSLRFIAVYTAFCWLMAALDFYLYYRLKRIDLNVLTVKDACLQAARFGVLRQRLWLLSVTLLVPVLFYLFYEIVRFDDVYMLVGAAAGGLIGLIAGLRKDRKIRRMIRDFCRSLEDDDAESDE